MERIDLHNYEAYFLDYLEGNLSDAGQADLALFLSGHPELNDELAAMGDMDSLNLAAPEVSLDTAFLKADPTALSLFTAEDWMISSVEGTLTDAQNAELNLFVESNGLTKTFATYKATVLTPNHNETFGSTKPLKRNGGLVIPFYVKVLSAAAVVALVFTIVDTNGEQEFQNDAINSITASNKFEKKSRSELKIRPLELNTIIENDNWVHPNLNSQQDQNFADNVIPNFVDQDTTNQLPLNIVPEDPIVQIPSPNVDTIQQQNKIDPLIKLDDDNQDDVAVHQPPTKETEVVTEEPYKLITKTTSNLLNRDVTFTRDRKKDSQDYVAYHFKIGRFEFDRKKSN